MRTPFPRLLASLALATTITACGGGGGGGSGGEPVVPPPVNPPPVDPPPVTGTTYSISGTVTASQSQSVDSDTNDPARAAIRNDIPFNAQPIANPVTLGGYVNQPGTGAPGRSQEAGDIDDFFRVALLRGQRVTMVVADFEIADADLYLYDMQGNILDFSIDTGDIETVIIPSDGTYLINAFAFSGATSYILSVGAPDAPTLPSTAMHNIVHWEAVVKYRKDTDDQAVSHALGMEQRAGGHGRARLMALHRGQVSAQQLQRRMGTAGDKLEAINDTDVRARWETLHAIKSLRKDPRVRSAEPNFRVHTMARPNDEAYRFQWHYPLIGLPDAWETTSGNSNIVVAVVDTGVLPEHPDLQGNLVTGFDFVRDRENSGDGGGIDPDPRDPGGDFGAGSNSFHGTHVIGTVAARGNNRRGVAGTAYGSRVMPLRALGVDGGGTTYDVDQAIRYAAGLPNDSGTVPAQPAQIINLSLGGAPFTQETQNLFNEVRAQGVVVVAAAGNEATSAPGYPASYAGVISVSAVDIQRRLAAYSNTGRNVDVAAPGGDNSVDINGDGFPDGVLSTGGSFSGGGISYVYSFLNGTSMATPHVAGVLALMLSVNPDLTPEDIDALLRDGKLSDDLGTPGRDDLFGYGLINAQSAVLAALEAGGTSPADNPRLVASTDSLNFGSAANRLELVLRNGGKGELALESLSVSEPWLQIDPANVDAGGLGTYTVSVSRGDLAVGIYSADVTAQSSVNDLLVQVLVSVGAADAAADVGVIYILLYDPAQDEPVAQFSSGGSGAEYAYEFSGIPEGEYEIVAGSDADNDLLICDAGEACGAWLTTDQPIRFTLDSNRTAVDFPIEFQVALPRVNAQLAAEGVPVTTARRVRTRSGEQ